jgi:hypothetical protein
MIIDLSDELTQLVQKLQHCQDSKTSARRFYGNVRLDYVVDTTGEVAAVLTVEETVWETESGDSINTSSLRAA